VIEYEWRGVFGNEEINILHAEGFDHRVLDDDFWGVVNRHSLGWVVARRDGGLVGWVNVAWDGAVHAFILDTLVAKSARRSGIGKELVALATVHAREAGCEWLHVDFDDDLRAFYYDACGFRPTDAGLIRLV
jgi:ribosomal protein S18 acetylase RimI-like enzyme